MALLATFDVPELCDVRISLFSLTLVTPSREDETKKRKRSGEEEIESANFRRVVLKDIWTSKAVLAAHSKYFKRMFTGGFNESITNVVCFLFDMSPCTYTYAG